MKKIINFFAGFFSLSRYVAKKIAHHRYTLFLADSPRHDDLYVVSFPKSGATWMDFLMANIHTEMSGKKKQINFFNIHSVIPDIHADTSIGPTALSFPGFRVIKSHADFNPYYRNVIYIIRDPRDVMLSYYRYLTGLGEFSGSISDLIRSSSYGIRAWVQHIDSWYLKSQASLRICFVRYEDLKKDAYAEVLRIYNTLGLEVPDDVLKQAICDSSFENMKQLEQEWNYGGRPVAGSFKFMQQGSSGTWNGTLSVSDSTYIESVGRDIMSRFGYLE